MKVYYRRFHRGALVFRVEVNGIVYAGCYLLDGKTFNMVSSADDYVRNGSKLTEGGWSLEDIRKLAWLGKVKTGRKASSG